MAAAFTGGDLIGSTSNRRSFGSTRVAAAVDVFSSVGSREKEDEEEELRWAAIERLPTFDRTRKGVLNTVLDSGGAVVRNEVDVTKLGVQQRKILMESILNVVEDDNENILRKVRERTDRNVLGLIRLAPSRKRKIQILQDVSGIVKPARMTLLLGPPGAGKTTMLLALAGKLDSDLTVSGKITYCGHEFSEFVPQRACAYISQHDVHHGEFTVRETFDFSGQCLGVGTSYETLAELSRREKAAGILPDPEIDAFMKATAVSGQKTSLVTDYILKQIPIWWRWYYWCSPVAWTLYGMVTSQVGDRENLVEIPGSPSLTVKQVLELGLGFEHSFLPAVVVAHLGFVCIFFFVFAFGIKFLNFQTR